MSGAAQTAAEWFFPATTAASGVVGGLATATGLEGLDESGTIAALREALEEQGGEAAWSFAREEVAARIVELVNVELAEVVAWAWTRAEELGRYLDPERYPPDKTVVAHLVEHTVKWSQDAALEVMAGEHKLGEIPVVATLELRLDGLALKIRNGRILELGPGQCRGSGKVTVVGKVLVERKMEPVELPGSIKLRKPSAIQTDTPEAATDPAEAS